MGAVFTLALKDLRLLLRDRVSLFWILAFPLLFALFFGTIFGGGGDDDKAAMPIVVVDESGGSAEGFIERLSDSDALEVDTVATLDEARDLVRRGKRIAFVHIRPDFSDSGFAMFGGGGDDTPTIGLGVDPSRNAERGMLQGVVTQAVFSGLMSQVSDPSKMRAQTDLVRSQLSEATGTMDPAQQKSLTTLMDALDSLSETTEAANTAQDDEASAPALGSGIVESVEVDRDRSGTPRSPYEVTFPSSLLWGLVGCATTFATTIVREHRAGTMFRLRVSPLSRAQILAGKGLACVMAGMGASAILLTVGVVALGVRVGNPALLVLATLCTAACFAGVMMVMSVIGRTEAAVSGGSWTLIMPLAMVGGGMIPLIAMPSWLLTVGNISPFKWGIYAIEGAIWRDLSLVEVLPSLLVLLGGAVLLFGLGVWILRRREP